MSLRLNKDPDIAGFCGGVEDSAVGGCFCQKFRRVKESNLADVCQHGLELGKSRLVLCNRCYLSVIILTPHQPKSICTIGDSL